LGCWDALIFFVVVTDVKKNGQYYREVIKELSDYLPLNKIHHLLAAQMRQLICSSAKRKVDQERELWIRNEMVDQQCLSPQCVQLHVMKTMQFCQN